MGFNRFLGKYLIYVFMTNFPFFVENLLGNNFNLFAEDKTARICFLK